MKSKQSEKSELKYFLELFRHILLMCDKEVVEV